MPRAARTRLALLLIVFAGLGACSGDDDRADAGAARPSATLGAATPSVPEGVVLTEPGTVLDFGEPAVVGWRPTTALDGVLELTVEKVSEQRPAVFRGWLRDDAARSSRPYFVTVSVVNQGEDDLGGQQVPLYVLDDRGRLSAPWTMGGDFEACQSGPMPEDLTAGGEARMCLVYLVPQQGTAQELVFQPSETFDAIRWTGRVRTPKGAPSRS